MYPSLNTGALEIQVDFDRAVELARAHGFQALDFSVVQVAELAAQRGLESIRRQLAQANVRLGAWGLPVRWRGSEAEWREGMARLPEWAALAVALGSDRAVTVVMPGDDERPPEENRAFHRERLAPIVQILAEAGCRLGLEFIGPRTLRETFRYPFLHTLEQVRDLARELGPNVGLLVDLFHLYTGHTPVDRVRALDRREVVAVHVNDALPGRGPDEQMDLERALPGEHGVMDVVGFLRALAHMGYDGPVAVEPFSARLAALPPEARVEETAAALRRCWEAAGLSWEGATRA